MSRVCAQTHHLGLFTYMDNNAPDLGLMTLHSDSAEARHAGHYGAAINA